MQIANTPPSENDKMSADIAVPPPAPKLKPADVNQSARPAAFGSMSDLNEVLKELLVKELELSKINMGRFRTQATDRRSFGRSRLT